MIRTLLRLAGVLFALVMAAFLLAPITVVVASSFTATSFISFPPQGFSWKWYLAVWENRAFAEALWLSLVVASITALVSGAIGAAAAIGLYRGEFRGRDLVLQLLSLPLIIPAVVLGVGLLQFFARLGVLNGPHVLVLAHVVITLPYVVRLVLAGLAGSDPNLERAAAGLGAGPLRIFFRVTLPRVARGLAAGMIFAFVVSLDDTGLAIFLVNSTDVTLPVQIFNYITFNYDPIITAAGSLMVYVAVIAVIVIERIVGLGRAMAAETSGMASGRPA